MEFNQEIGKRLKELRESIMFEGKNCSQDKLIEILGLNISQNTLSQIEKGKKTAPAYDVLIKYSEYFNVSLDQLITGKEYQIKQKDAEFKPLTFADIVSAANTLMTFYPADFVISTDNWDMGDKLPDECRVIMKQPMPHNALFLLLKEMQNLKKAHEMANNGAFRYDVYGAWLRDTLKSAKDYLPTGEYNSIFEPPLKFLDSIPPYDYENISSDGNPIY